MKKFPCKRCGAKIAWRNKYFPFCDWRCEQPIAAAQFDIRSKDERLWSICKKMDKAYWYILRKEIFRLQGVHCLKCGSGDKLNIDHIKPKSKYPELEYDLDNLQVLCWKCNMRKAAIYQVDYRNPQISLAL